MRAARPVAHLTVIFRNQRHARSSDYERFAALPRPGHADFTGRVRYRGFADPRGSRPLLGAPHRSASSPRESWPKAYSRAPPSRRGFSGPTVAPSLKGSSRPRPRPRPTELDSIGAVVEISREGPPRRPRRALLRLCRGDYFAGRLRRARRARSRVRRRLPRRRDARHRAQRPLRRRLDRQDERRTARAASTAASPTATSSSSAWRSSRLHHRQAPRRPWISRSGEGPRSPEGRGPARRLHSTQGGRRTRGRARPSPSPTYRSFPRANYTTAAVKEDKT